MITLLLLFQIPYVSPSVRRKTPWSNLLMAKKHSKAPIHWSTYILDDDAHPIFLWERRSVRNSCSIVSSL